VAGEQTPLAAARGAETQLCKQSPPHPIPQNHPFVQCDVTCEPPFRHDDSIRMAYKESLKATLFPEQFCSITQQYLLTLTKEGSN